MIFLRNYFLCRCYQPLRFLFKYSTIGVDKWSDELSSQIKLEIEKHWRHVATKKISNDSSVYPKYYALSMFPYPSGQLHMGHVRVYSISDTISRFMRMNGYDVIHPMGWDAFGLPAENAAFDRKVPPQKWTKDNIEKMKCQLMELGCIFDWEREINTSDPKYYKWTQALFLELFKSGLIYQKKALVNWDPVDQTVLADEQVDMNGCSWRSGAKVEKRLLNQWFIKTTFFAKQLYEGLNDPILENWRDIIQLQRHWIGECNGISVDFLLSYIDENNQFDTKVTVWTDKPESLMSASFIAVKPESSLDKINLIAKENKHYKMLSVTAKNPINDQIIPIFVTGDVLYSEGCDVYMGSAELDSDKSFMLLANIPFSHNDSATRSNSNINKTRNMVCDLARQKNVGGYPISSKLKDWLISRQRYWGTPIPIVHCKSCGSQPVPSDQLPVVLPQLEVFERGGMSPLLKVDGWINTECPSCGNTATRETDTMDTFVDSSWYFFRFLDPHNTKFLFDKDKVWETTPVDLYIGGKEHAVLHLYYARFMAHFLHSIGKIPEREPFKKLLVQGMVMGKSYKIVETGEYIPESRVKIVNENKGIAETIDTGKPVEILWEKMSKSKFNGVDPSQMFNNYGCDTTRLLILADVSPISNRNWSDATFPGILNWQKRLWLTMKEFLDSRNSLVNEDERKKIITSDNYVKIEKTLWDSRNYFISQTTFSFNFTHQLSVGISRMQGLTNSLRRVETLLMGLSSEFEKTLAVQIIMLAPVAPHFACELWSAFIRAPGRINTSHESIAWDKDVVEQQWPIIDAMYQLELLCKVNGSDICRIKLLPSEINLLDTEKAFELAMQNKKFVKNTKKGICKSSLQLYPNCRAVMNSFTEGRF